MKKQKHSFLALAVVVIMFSCKTQLANKIYYTKMCHGAFCDTYTTIHFVDAYTFTYTDYTFIFCGNYFVEGNKIRLEPTKRKDICVGEKISCGLIYGEVNSSKENFFIKKQKTQITLHNLDSPNGVHSITLSEWKGNVFVDTCFCGKSTTPNLVYTVMPQITGSE